MLDLLMENEKKNIRGLHWRTQILRHKQRPGSGPCTRPAVASSMNIRPRWRGSAVRLLGSRLDEYGSNTAVHERTAGWWLHLLRAFNNAFIVHIIRARRRPFIESRASAPLTFLTVAVTLAGLIIPFTAFGSRLGLCPLPAAYFGWLVLVLAAYFVLAPTVKNWLARRFGF